MDPGIDNRDIYNSLNNIEKVLQNILEVLREINSKT